MTVASLVYDDPALSAFELDFVDAGERCRLPLGQAWNRQFEAADPVWEFRWAKGGQGFAGWYFSATVGDHVAYESWLERDRLILLDREPEVVGIASQPFWLHWHDGQRRRRHAPDYFVRLADGRGRAVDVRAGDRIDRADAEAFAATERVCRAVGWEFDRVGEPEPVLMENVRWLSRYRRRRCADPEIAERLLDVFADQSPVGTPGRLGRAIRWWCCRCCSTCCGMATWSRTWRTSRCRRLRRSGGGLGERDTATDRDRGRRVGALRWAAQGSRPTLMPGQLRKSTGVDSP